MPDLVINFVSCCSRCGADLDATVGEKSGFKAVYTVPCKKCLGELDKIKEIYQKWEQNVYKYNDDHSELVSARKALIQISEVLSG